MMNASVKSRTELALDTSMSDGVGHDPMSMYGATRNVPPAPPQPLLQGGTPGAPGAPGVATAGLDGDGLGSAEPEPDADAEADTDGAGANGSVSGGMSDPAAMAGAGPVAEWVGAEPDPGP
jgi:hypothetical protein